MTLWTQYIDPAELSSYARTDLANQPANRNQLRQWLPSKFIADLDYEYESGQGALGEIAMYRSYDAATRVGALPTTQRKRGELPPISEQIRVGEYDRLRNQNNADGRIRDVLESATARLAQKVEKRFEVARGYVLVNAAMDINENRLKQNAPFGRNGNRTANATDPWTNTGTADWINDTVGWMGIMSDENGEPPGAILTSTRVKRLMLTNLAARAQVPIASNGAPTRVGNSGLQLLLDENSLPPIYTYDGAYINAAGTKQKVIPDNKVILLPAPVDPDSPEDTELGATVWGRPAEALNPEYNLAEVGEEGGIFAALFKDNRPEAVWAYVSAIGMPIVFNPDLTFVATVAAP